MKRPQYQTWEEYDERCGETRANAKKEILVDHRIIKEPSSILQLLEFFSRTGLLIGEGICDKTSFGHLGDWQLEIYHPLATLPASERSWQHRQR